MLLGRQGRAVLRTVLQGTMNSSLKNCTVGARGWCVCCLTCRLPRAPGLWHPFRNRKEQYPWEVFKGQAWKGAIPFCGHTYLCAREAGKCVSPVPRGKKDMDLVNREPVSATRNHM